MTSVFSCKQLYCLIKNVKSRTKTCLIHEHSGGRMWIATAQIKPDIERLLKQK
jgi:hypothetical protein